MDDILLTQREKDIATVILNRPEKLNALSRALWLRVGQAMRDLSSDETLRCIVVRGAGQKAFSPGADISEFSAHRSDRQQARAYGALIQEAMQAIRDCQHPVIAMILGVCVGGGLELASMCDLRICGESSRFGVPINRIAITMAYPEIRALIDLVGRATALEIVLEGRVFGVPERQRSRAWSPASFPTSRLKRKPTPPPAASRMGPPWPTACTRSLPTAYWIPSP